MQITKNHILLTFVCVLGIASIQYSQAQPEPLFGAHNPKYDKIRVLRVLSVDTFLLEGDEKVQLIGVKSIGDAPRKKIETNEFGFVIEESKPFDTLESRAMEFASNLCEDQWVRLEFDSQRRGNYNTLLAYVYLIDDGIFVNKELLEQGFATLSLKSPNLKKADQLRSAYQRARQEKRGIHGE